MISRQMSNTKHHSQKTKIHPQDILIVPQHTFHCESEGRAVTWRNRSSTTYHPPFEEEEVVIISRYIIIVLVDDKAKLCGRVNEQAKP